MNSYGGGNYLLCLLWAELEYDVKYALWRRVKATGAQDENSASLAISDSNDKDFLLRCFQTAVDALQGVMKPYADRAFHRMSTDELLEVPKEYNIRLHFEDGWLGDSNALLSMAHSYVTNYSIGEVLRLNGDALATAYETRARSLLNSIRAEANSFNVESPIFML